MVATKTLLSKITNKILYIFIAGIITFIFISSVFLKAYSAYGDFGDLPVNGWILWYNHYSIVTGRVFNQNNYFNSYQFSVFPYSLAYSDHLFIPSLIYSLNYLISQSHLFSVNAYLLLTFIFTFIASFYLIFCLTKNKLASLIGSIVFTFNPLTFSHFLGHLQLMNKFFLPLVFLFLFRMLASPSFKNSFLFYVFFVLNSLSAIYFFVFTLISIPIAAAPFMFYNLWNKNFTYFLNLAKYSSMGIFFLPILIYFNLPYWNFSKSEGVVRTLSENNLYSAELVDWISSHPDSFLYGKLIRSIEKIRNTNSSQNFNYSEHTLGLNILPLTLFILGLIYFKTRYNRLPTSLYLTLLGLICLSIFTFLLSLGPFLEIGRNFNITMPFYYIYQSVSLLQGVRAPSRIQFLFYIPFAVIMSYGVMQLQNIKGVNKNLLCFFLITIIIGENLFSFDYNSKSVIYQNYNQKYIDKKLGFLKDQLTVHLPFNLEDLSREAIYLNWSVLTKERILNGYSGYTPPDFKIFMEDINSSSGKQTIHKFKLLDLKYIVFHKDIFNKHQKEQFNNNRILYEQGTVYEDPNVLVVSLNNYDQELSKCSFDEHLSIKLEADIPLNSLRNSTRHYGKFIAANNNNCYMVNTGFKRYIKHKIKIGEKQFTFHLKIPLLIEPFGRIKLSNIST